MHSEEKSPRGAPKVKVRNRPKNGQGGVSEGRGESAHCGEGNVKGGPDPPGKRGEKEKGKFRVSNREDRVFTFNRAISAPGM